MGIFKKIFGAAEREAKNVTFQQRAVLKADKISKGEKVSPPKYATEEKHFKDAVADPKLRELVNKKDEPLIDKLNKIKITRTDPPERPKSHRALPTRETEAHRSFDVWEFGFYEPSLEKMDKNKLMLREAMEILRARMELDPPDYDQPPRENQDDALALLESHPACKRVDQEKLDLVWKYFRPFARSDKQVIVSKDTLLELRRIMQARDDEAQFLTNQYEWRKYFEEKLADTRRQRLREYYHGLEEEEKTKFLDKVKEQRQIEHKRLHDQMEELYKMEEEDKAKSEEPSTEGTKKRIEGSGRS